MKWSVLFRPAAHDVEALVPLQKPAEPSLRLAETAHAVLHDDDRPVDDQAEVDRSEAHQVSADAMGDHSRDGEQHRQGDHQSRQKRGAGVSEEEQASKVADEIPAGRLGKPEEFRKLCAFLCSIHAGYITGRNHILDGGLYKAAF